MSTQQAHEIKLKVKVIHHKSYVTITVSRDEKYIRIKVNNDFKDLLKYVAMHKNKIQMKQDEYIEEVEINVESFYDLILQEIINNNKHAKRLLSLISF